MEIELLEDIGEKVEMGLKEVDMELLIGKKLVEKMIRKIVEEIVEDLERLIIRRERVILKIEVRLEKLIKIMENEKRRKGMEVRKELKEDNEINKIVGVMNLIDGLIELIIWKESVKKIVEKKVVKKIMV